MEFNEDYENNDFNNENIEVVNTQSFQVHESAQEESFSDMAAQILGPQQSKDGVRIFLSRISGGKKGTLKVVEWDDIDEVEVDQVGREFGSGKYSWTIQYHDSKLRRLVSKRLTKTLLPDFYDLAHQEYNADSKKNLPATQDHSGLDIIERLAGIAGLGANKQDNSSLLIAMMNSQSNQQQIQAKAASEQNQVFMQKMGEMQMSMMTMMIGVMQSKNNNTEGDMFDKAMDKVSSIIGLKNMLSPAPVKDETMVDKVFKLVSDNMWIVEKLSTMSPAQRQNDFAMKMIQNSDEISHMKEHPEDKLAVIQKVAAAAGEDQVIQLLGILGWDDPRK